MSNRASTRIVSSSTSVSSNVLFSRPSKSESESKSVFRMEVSYLPLKVTPATSTEFRPKLKDRDLALSLSPPRPEISKPSVVKALPLTLNAASPNISQRDNGADLAFERFAAAALNTGAPALGGAACAGDDVDDAANRVRAVKGGLLAAQDFDFDDIFRAQSAEIKCTVRRVRDFNAVNDDDNLVGFRPAQTDLGEGARAAALADGEAGDCAEEVGDDALVAGFESLGFRQGLRQVNW